MTHNPWLTIWTKPRQTIASITATNPNRSLWLLAAIYGFSSVLNAFQSLAMGYQIGLFAIFLLAAVLSPIWGYINITLWSWIVYLTGKLIRGTGTFQTVRSAYAWSCVPLLINIPLWLILAFLFGSQLFTNFAAQPILTNLQVTVLFVILLARIASVIWSLVIYINALAEVQQFSILRAIGNILLSSAVVLLIAYLFILLLNIVAEPTSQATSFLDCNLFQTLRYL